ncbi:hypothetical protein OEZ86_007021 [Tetradesmus obliquus]|nr:hypothetical protein OEZ86_007021 [Tetradesmus obliquus]
MPGLGKGLTPGQVSSLLLAALQGPTTAKKCISMLLNVPAAQEMQWDSCEALLEAALMQHSTGAADVLPDLVGQLPLLARKMSFDQLQRTYQAAAQRYNDEALRLYVRLPALLQPQQVTGLLAAAVRHAKSLTSALLLCKLPAASRMAAVPAAGLIDDAQAALSGIREALEKDKADSFSSSTRRMMKSMPFSVYSRKRAGNALSLSQVARQTVAAATGAVLAEQPAPEVRLRVWLGMQVVAALQELQIAATHDV